MSYDVASLWNLWSCGTEVLIALNILKQNEHKYVIWLQAQIKSCLIQTPGDWFWHFLQLFPSCYYVEKPTWSLNNIIISINSISEIHQLSFLSFLFLSIITKILIWSVFHKHNWYFPSICIGLLALVIILFMLFYQDQKK